jgi:sporulation protein YlmC with PRC-barrel domain
MNKTRKILVVALAVFGLMLWGSSSYAQYSDYAVGGSNTFQASWLIGRQVMNTDRIGTIGQISDLLIDRCAGRVAFLVLSDTPGLGGEKIAVPFDALLRNGPETFRLTFDREISISSNYLSKDMNIQDQYSQYLARSRDFIGVKANQGSLDSQWAEEVYKVYGFAPYWTEEKPSQFDLVSYIANRTSGDPMIIYPSGRLDASSFGSSSFWAGSGEACYNSGS